MYHALLTNRYLTTRVIPLIAVAAVALCVALVIIVVSVMSGFLNMVKASGKILVGDVVIASGNRGIPHYERLLERLRELPEVAAATPLVESFGMLRMPYGMTATVQFWGVDPATFTRVTGFKDTLVWKTNAPVQQQSLAPGSLLQGDPNQIVQDALSLTDSRTGRPGIVMGVYVSIANQRQRDGTYRPEANYQPAWEWWMPLHSVTLSTFPLESGLNVEQTESVILPVINEFSSGVFLIDERRVIIPIEVAQKLLHLQEGELTSDLELDASGLPKVIGVDPARATQVLVRARDGIGAPLLRDAVEQGYRSFLMDVEADETARVKPPTPGRGVTIKTWDQQQAQFLGPIEKERELMRTLFSIVYLVCAALVLAIFWAIVHEKTRDIGILRSIGASRGGVVWIFLRYGFVIGVGGAIVGAGLGWLVVHNINAIHTAMGDPPVWLVVAVWGLAMGSGVLSVVLGLRGRLMPIVLGCITTLTLALAGAGILWVRQMGGIIVWDPKVYLFTTIPNQVDIEAAVTTMIGAVIFSLIGAVLPAAKAADTDPVTALRYE